MIQQYSASMLLCLLQASLTRAFKVPAHARCMRLCRPAALCVPCSAARQLLAWASESMIRCFGRIPLQYASRGEVQWLCQQLQKTQN